MFAAWHFHFLYFFYLCECFNVSSLVFTRKMKNYARTETSFFRPCVTFTRALINAAYVMAEKRFYELCRRIFFSLQQSAAFGLYQEKETRKFYICFGYCRYFQTFRTESSLWNNSSVSLR